MELISIVVPVYNVAPFLEKCLNSILYQTYENIEIIVVDDGSTDGCGKICDSYSEKYDKITVIHKENGGLSDARNKGIAHAKGEYIIFVDSDDVVAPDMVMYLYTLIKKYNGDIGICDPVHCFQTKDIMFSKATKEVVFQKEEAIAEMLYQRSFLTSAWGKIFPKNYFDKITFPVGMLFEDSAIMYKLFDEATRIVYGNAALYAYIHRENSITTRKFSDKDCDILKICESMEAYFKDRSDTLKNAAMVYHGAAAFRIYMNAPKGQGFDEYINKAKDYLDQYGRVILKDHNIRKKMKMALLLYQYAKPLMPLVYRFVDRWK